MGAMTAERRHRRSRIVARRWRVLSRFHDAPPLGPWWSVGPGRFDKYNGCCSCGLCRDPKYRDSRATTALAVRREIEAQLAGAE